MIERTHRPGRRWFLRSATGGALSVVALGAQALFGASPAAADEDCCLLVGPLTAWCPVTCAGRGRTLRCWGCNNDRCRCCECTGGGACILAFFASCSYRSGCCREGE